MAGWYRRRWLDLVASIYIYNEHRGYSALDRLLEAMRSVMAEDPAFIAEVEQHRADEYKHYLMFKRWFERRGQMPLLVDRTCGHIDRFIEIMTGSHIEDVDTHAILREEQNFAKMCRVIALTERRGYRQLQILLRHPFVRADRRLTKIFEIIREDEPRHWAPYENWLKRHRAREPVWWERLIDLAIHSELLLIKLPLLFLKPRMERRSNWPDGSEACLPDTLPAAAAR